MNEDTDKSERKRPRSMSPPDRAVTSERCLINEETKVDGRDEINQESGCAPQIDRSRHTQLPIFIKTSSIARMWRRMTALKSPITILPLHAKCENTGECKQEALERERGRKRTRSESPPGGISASKRHQAPEEAKHNEREECKQEVDQVHPLGLDTRLAICSFITSIWFATERQRSTRALLEDEAEEALPYESGETTPQPPLLRNLRSAQPNRTKKQDVAKLPDESTKKTPITRGVAKKFKRFLRNINSEQSADLIIRHFAFLKAHYNWKQIEQDVDARDGDGFLEFPDQHLEEVPRLQFLFSTWYYFKDSSNLTKIPSVQSRRTLWGDFVANIEQIEQCMLEVESSAALFFETLQAAPIIIETAASCI